MSWRLLTVSLVAAGTVFSMQALAEATVKSSKSNSSDRMGGGGGARGAGQLEATTVRPPGVRPGVRPGLQIKNIPTGPGDDVKISKKPVRPAYR
jgi:hypothetical protein